MRPTSKSPTVYDVLIIGAGQAGPPLAIELARKKWRVALAERKNLGGSCVNFGCTPTKAVIASARVAHLARRGTEFGVRIPTVEPNLAAVLDRARGIVLQSRAGLREAFANEEGIRLIGGHARFEGREGKAFRLRVGDEVLLASGVVLDTGTRSRIPKIPGLGRIDYRTAENWIDRPELPAHLAILGGGYTGLEMAQFYRRMGSRVTVIEQSPEIASDEDEEVARALRLILESEEIAFRLETTVARVERDGAGVRLLLKTKRSDRLTASHLFVATGRRPNTDDLGLETIRLKTSRDGTIPVTSRLATKVRGVWAAGDIRGGPMFTHTAWDDFRVLASQLAGDRSRTTRGRIVPYAIYTDPQLGRVGMTAAEAKKSGRKVKVGRFELRSNGKAREIGETEGFIQVVVDARSDRILGAAVLAHEGAELVHLFVDLMNAGGRSASIRDAVHIHPTLAEAVQSAVAALK
jgi:pyruvate/2-oxoglutarate dehydrogenase complex dihydrolipoamide dehydrogenase (E3) component